MNVTELTNALHTKINSSTNLEEILLLTKAVERLKLGNVNVVQNFSDLASVKFEPSSYGRLYFVTIQQQLYLFFNTDVWIPILNRAAPLPYGWGNNTNGRLGDNTVVGKSSPVSVVGGFADWIQVSACESHTLGVRANGTAWAWGNNSNGRLGDSTSITRESPVSVSGGFTDWVQLSGGNGHSLGVRANGTAWAWGSNAVGQLGDNSIASKNSPVLVAGSITDWTQVSAGAYHSTGRRLDGSIWAWGLNSSNQLGDNTTVGKSSPVPVVGGYTDWIQVSAGGTHNLGLRSNGTAWAWGQGGNGRLGNGSSLNQSSPVSVVGGFTDWTQLSAGGFHSLGLRVNGTAWAWGAGIQGILGDNTTVDKSSPVTVVGGFTDWIQTSAGVNHSLGVRSNGTAWAWGYNFSGQLGDGTTVSKRSPVSVVGGFTDWIQVSADGGLQAAGGHSIGLKTS